MVRLELTTEQQHGLDSRSNQPAHLIDPRDQAEYVLIPVDQYDRVREFIEEDRVRKALTQVATRNAAGRMNDAP
jgi:hypothetical protein